MMDMKRLHEILNDTTAQLRKGEVIREEKRDGLDVLTIDAMPHESEVGGVEKVDLQFLTIGVDKAKAEKRRAELVALLDDYPQPARLASGPSYIEVGAEIGDQGAAFQLFALVKVLGLWEIITPASFGLSGPEAADLAGRGFIMITGYKPGNL